MKLLEWNIEGTESRFSEEVRKRVAIWFYLIAGLSAISTLIYYFGGTSSFLIGLGITHLIESIVAQIDFGHGLTVLKIGTLGLELVIAATFVLFGFAAGKWRGWVIIVETALYFLDGVLLFALGEYYSVGFHAFIIFIILKTYWSKSNIAETASTSER